MKLFHIGGRGNGKVAAMKAAEEMWRYYDELRPKKSDPVSRAVAKAMAFGGEVFVGIDGDVAVISTRDGEGKVFVLDELPDVSHYDSIQRMVLDAYERMAAKHNAFLADAFSISPAEREGVMSLDPQMMERIRRRMNEEGNLPSNFWNTVEAYRMMEDKEGRELVAAIIKRKLGCNVERTSD